MIPTNDTGLNVCAIYQRPDLETSFSNRNNQCSGVHEYVATYLSNLHEVVGDMAQGGILKESELRYEKILWTWWVKPDLDATLENIPNLGAERLCELYQDSRFLELPNVMMIHDYVLENLPKPAKNTGNMQLQECLNKGYLEAQKQDEPSAKKVAGVFLKLGANPESEVKRLGEDLTAADKAFFNELYEELSLIPKDKGMPYPVEKDVSLEAKLEQYDQNPSEDLEKAIICSSIFKGNAKLTERYLAKRKAIASNGAEIDQLNEETTRFCWMTDEEREVRKEREKSGNWNPSVWYELACAVRTHYNRMDNAVGHANKIQRRVHDEGRWDMKRYAVNLLKYYGFDTQSREYSWGQITHRAHQKYLEKKDPSNRNYEGGFAYDFMNHDFDHLENEIRDDLRAIGVPEDELPPRYCCPPKATPSPVKTQEELYEIQNGKMY